MITLKFSVWPGDVGIPGTWTKRNDRVLMCCPLCKKIGGLDDHVTAADGTVSPSVVCPRKGCTFHEKVVLEGWE